MSAFAEVDEVRDAKSARKQRQAFYTPVDLVADLLAWADVYPSARTLEPSSGDGRIVHALLAYGVKSVDACEIDAEMRCRCESLGARIVGEDFLKLKPAENYDRIVMNPPFKGTTWIRHIEHAWKMLRPGGRILSITPKSVEQLLPFRKLDLPGCAYATYELLSESRFKEYDTGIVVAVVEIHKDRPGENRECNGYSNLQTFNAVMSIASDRKMAEKAKKNSLPMELENAFAKYIGKAGASCYGINWDEVSAESQFHFE